MSGIASGDDRDLSGRVVIITGAGQGIGRQYALSFAAAGAIPIVAEINGANARRVAEEVTGAGGKALAVELDVADPESCNRMAAKVMETYGRIDVLINNAAIFSSLKKNVFDKIPLNEWEQVLKVNVTGSYLCACAVAPAMRAARWGRIVNVSTSSVLAGTSNYLHYVTSKAAVEGMTIGLARELGPFDVTVNTLVPSATMTEVEREGFTEASSKMVASRQCLPRGSTPQDIVGLALFLASPASGFVTGQTIAVNGGLTHG